MDKKQSRLRRATQTRAKIAELKVNRLAVHRTNTHIYASVIGPDANVLASASTLEAEVRAQLAGQTGKGAKIAELKVNRLAVHRTNTHIYASVIGPDANVLASASTLEAEVRAQLAGQTGKGGNAAAAALIGKRVAEKALKAGVTEVAFDRSGFRYHGRVKALAEAAREAGLKF